MQQDDGRSNDGSTVLGILALENAPLRVPGAMGNAATFA